MLRQYVAAAFDLPPGELTTAEFCNLIERHEAVGQELARALNEFLHRCDERKFAPSPATQPLGAAAGALKLIDQAESRRAALRQAAPSAAAAPVKSGA